MQATNVSKNFADFFIFIPRITLMDFSQGNFLQPFTDTSKRTMEKQVEKQLDSCLTLSLFPMYDTCEYLDTSTAMKYGS